MHQNKTFSMLGLAKRAGQAALGATAAEAAVKSGEAKLVVISESASGNTSKKFKNMCAFYEVPSYVYGGKEDLGKAVGKEECSVLAILDEGFSKAVLDTQPSAGGDVKCL